MIFTKILINKLSLLYFKHLEKNKGKSNEYEQIKDEGDNLLINY